MKKKFNANLLVGIVFMIVGLIPMACGALVFVLSRSIVGSAVPAFIGFVFFCVGAGLTIGAKVKMNRINRIYTEGVKLEVTVTDVTIHHHMKVNNHTPYTITARYTDDFLGKEYVFVSKYLTKMDNSDTFGITVRVNPYYKVGDVVTVYAMRDNYDEYFFDV